MTTRTRRYPANHPCAICGHYKMEHSDSPKMRGGRDCIYKGCPCTGWVPRQPGKVGKRVSPPKAEPFGEGAMFDAP